MLPGALDEPDPISPQGPSETRAIGRLSPPTNLTSRQLQVLRLVAESLIRKYSKFKPVAIHSEKPPSMGAAPSGSGEPARCSGCAARLGPTDYLIQKGDHSGRGRDEIASKRSWLRPCLVYLFIFWPVPRIPSRMAASAESVPGLSNPAEF